ncbi:hypothetical protein VP758_005220 [Vibrio harveyi]|nr:hypothetical protein [Vibrio harveyi]
MHIIKLSVLTLSIFSFYSLADATLFQAGEPLAKLPQGSVIFNQVPVHSKLEVKEGTEVKAYSLPNLRGDVTLYKQGTYNVTAPIKSLSVEKHVSKNIQLTLNEWAPNSYECATVYYNNDNGKNKLTEICSGETVTLFEDGIENYYLPNNGEVFISASYKNWFNDPVTMFFGQLTYADNTLSLSQDSLNAAGGSEISTLGNHIKLNTKFTRYH